MYYGLSALIGAIIAVMLVPNGLLSAETGVYASTVVIHLAGLLLVLALLLARRQRLRLLDGRLALWMYSGGLIGVLTTVFNNLAYGKISVSAILALGLLGQSLTALGMDTFGLMGMEKRGFGAWKLIGIAFVFAGVLILLLPFPAAAVVPVAVSFLSGATVVVSRTINARLTDRVGALEGTLCNYVVGLICGLGLLFLLGRGEPAMTQGLTVLPKNPLLYTGGLLGVATVVLSNLTVRKISALYMTLFLFAGQVGTGLLIDVVCDGGFLWRNLFGGLCVAAGMTVNLLLERKRAR